MRIEIQRVREQRLDLRPPEIPGRQADTVNHNHLGSRSVRAQIPIRARALERGFDQTAIRVNFKVALHRQRDPGCATYPEQR